MELCAVSGMCLRRLGCLVLGSHALGLVIVRQLLCLEVSSVLKVANLSGFEDPRRASLDETGSWILGLLRAQGSGYFE